MSDKRVVGLRRDLVDERPFKGQLIRDVRNPLLIEADVGARGVSSIVEQ